MQEAKGLYQLCYVYNNEINDSITAEQLAAIKRGEFNKLTHTELADIVAKLKSLKEAYFIASLNKKINLQKDIEMGIANI